MQCGDSYERFTPDASLFGHVLSGIDRFMSTQSPDDTRPERHMVDPAQSPPATDRPRGWVARVFEAVDVVAPLANRSAPNPDQFSGDWRSRLAFLFGVISVLYAVLKFIQEFFGWIRQPVALLITSPGYLITILLVGSALFALYAAARATTLRQRRVALSGLSVIMLGGAAWGGWSFFNDLRPPGEFLILIGDFANHGVAPTDYAWRIDRELRAELQDSAAPVTVVRSGVVYEDDAAAIAAGRRYQANLVIWGGYDASGAQVEVEVLRLVTATQPIVTLPVLFSTVQASTPNAPAALELAQQNAALLTRRPIELGAAQFALDQSTGSVLFATAAIMGMGLYGEGKLDAALALFDKALTAIPEEQPRVAGVDAVLFLRAGAHYRLNRVEQAIADFERAVALNPDFFAAYYNLALAYSASCAPARQLKQAIAAAEQAVSLRPNDASAHRLLAGLLLEAGDAPAALAAVTVDGAVTEVESQALLATIYQAMGRTADAEQMNHAVITYWQTNQAADTASALDAALALGEAHLMAGALEVASAQFLAAHELAPADPRPLQGLSRASYAQGAYDQAASQVLQWLALAPDDAAAYLFAGILDQKLERHEQAVAALQQAQRLAPCSVWPHLALAHEHWLANDLDAYERELRTAQTIEPANTHVLFSLGMATFLRQQPEEAKALLRQALAQEPNLPYAHLVLGEIYMSEQDYAGAVAAWEQLLKLLPPDAAEYGPYAYALGQAYAMQSQWTDALTAYEKALAVGETSAIRYSMGLVYLAQRQDEEAVAAFERALELDPQNADAQAALDQPRANPTHRRP
jgi:tetratricopeptide (TPR) repeat protein